jgi:predicted dehydrogenase
MEKPLAITVPEANRIIQACQQAGVNLSVAYQGRFEPLTRQFHAAVQSGRLGRLLLASLYVKWYRDDAYYRSGAWRGAWQTEGGGALVTQASHGLDLLLWLAGPASSVHAQMATLNHAIEVEDAVQALLTFENGALGLVEATTVAYPGFSVRLELSGTGGSVVYDHGAGTLHWFLRHPKGEWVDQGEASDGSRAPLAISPTSHVPLYADFVAAIREGRTPAIDGVEALRSVELIQAIYRSARTGRRMRLSHA